MKRRSIKIQLYFNETQRQMAKESEGLARYVFNRALWLKKDRYENFKENLSVYEISWMFTLMRQSDKYAWMRKVSRSIIDQSLMNLEKSYKSFFKGKGFPKFKKKNQNISFVLTDPSKIINRNHIKLPRFGLVKMRGLRAFSGDIKNVTVSRVGDKYYATFSIEDVVTKERKYNKKKTKVVGLDVNLENFLTDSNGLRIENPRIKKDHSGKIKFYQRKAAKCQKGSSRKKRWNLKIQREYQKINNKKQDFTHKLSHSYVKNHDIIIVENLQINNMLKNHKLAEAISMVSWGEFFRQLEYKAGFYGASFIKVPPHNTSKDCSVCGYRNDTLTLSDRTWICPSCKTAHNRDQNSANNIKIKGQGMILKAIGDTNISWVSDIGNYLKIKHEA